MKVLPKIKDQKRVYRNSKSAIGIFTSYSPKNSYWAKLLTLSILTGFPIVNLSVYKLRRRITQKRFIMLKVKKSYIEIK